jgi:hypothetical protein
MARLPFVMAGFSIVGEPNSKTNKHSIFRFLSFLRGEGIFDVHFRRSTASFAAEAVS